MGGPIVNNYELVFSLIKGKKTVKITPIIEEFIKELIFDNYSTVQIFDEDISAYLICFSQSLKIEKNKVYLTMGFLSVVENTKTNGKDNNKKEIYLLLDNIETDIKKEYEEYSLKSISEEKIEDYKDERITRQVLELSFLLVDKKTKRYTRANRDILMNIGDKVTTAMMRFYDSIDYEVVFTTVPNVTLFVAVPKGKWTSKQVNTLQKNIITGYSKLDSYGILEIGKDTDAKDIELDEREKLLSKIKKIKIPNNVKIVDAEWGIDDGYLSLKLIFA